LEQADVIVYDALVSDAVLDFARPDTRREFAGKRGGRPSPRQADISLRLVELAREGHRVLRLKGGDPFVFGRGAEEAKALAQAGIRFRIIPGISAGLAGLAYAGIPATSRETNQALVLVTGHPAADEASPVDWDGLAKLDQPLVIYMGLTHLAEIVAALQAGGRPADTPVAVITRATLADQDVLETTLGQAFEAVAERGTATPVLIVVGRIVSLRQALLPFQIGVL